MPLRLPRLRPALVAALFLMTGAVLFWAPAPAHACSCAQVPAAVAVDDAEVVFAGTIEQLGRDEENDYPNDETWLMRVDDVYRGEVTETAGITAGNACSWPGRVGNHYVMLGSPGDVAGTYDAEWCTITSRGSSYADRLVVAAGPGHAPAPGSGPPEAWLEANDGETPLITPSLLLGAGLAVVAAGGALAWVRHRRRTNPLNL